MRFIVLISGRGSNLAAIIQAMQANLITGNLVSVISDNHEAPGLEYAYQQGIDTCIVEKKLYMDAARFNRNLLAAVNKYTPDLIVLAGFMRILSAEFIKNCSADIINIHPSLLPKYRGLNTHQRALDANESIHGASVHFVTEQLDAGQVIAYTEVNIDSDDNAKSLAAKVLAKEHLLYPTVIQWFASGQLHSTAQGVFLNNSLLTSKGIQI